MNYHKYLKSSYMHGVNVKISIFIIIFTLELYIKKRERVVEIGCKWVGEWGKESIK